MRLKKSHWIGIVFSAVIILIDLIFFFGEEIFYFVLGIGLVIVALPFLINYIIELDSAKEKNEKFLEFSRSLAESVKAGTPIGKSIINMSQKDFGSLTPHIQKLANQIFIGIPMDEAFETFSLEVESDTVSRAINLIREAQNAGGEIDNILDSVADSMYEVEKLKKERKSTISNLVVQGYIIFLIFIGIILVMEFQILPLTEGIGSFSGLSSGNVGSLTSSNVDLDTGSNAQNLTLPFLILLLVQGVFTGLTIGKIAEGSVKAGIKHSFVLAISAFLITSGARAFFG